MNNSMKIQFVALPENEAFARACISSFIIPLNPSLSELSDIKTAVSEGVTNAIVHAYPDGIGQICLYANIIGNKLHITIEDAGIGIKDIAQAREPFYTTKSQNEHSGMGFTVMETFMDNFKITSELGVGTKIDMEKNIGT